MLGTRMIPRVRPRSLYLGVTLAILLLPMHARADMVFTDSPTFLSALTSSFTETFESLTPNQTVPTGTSFSGNGFSFQVNAGFLDLFAFVANPPGSTISLSTDSILADTITLTFAPGTVNAVGGNFYNSDFNGDPTTSPVSLTLSNGTIEAFSSTTAPPYPYRGFIASSGFYTSLTMSIAAYNVLDNITVGLAPAAGVPEPSSFVLCGLGAVGALGWRLRRKKLAATETKI